MAGLQFEPAQLLEDVDYGAEDSYDPDEGAEESCGEGCGCGFVFGFGIGFGEDFREQVRDGNQHEYHASEGRSVRVMGRQNHGTPGYNGHGGEDCLLCGQLLVEDRYVNQRKDSQN